MNRIRRQCFENLEKLPFASSVFELLNGVNKVKLGTTMTKGVNHAILH